jgi:hypothetical protein
MLNALIRALTYYFAWYIAPAAVRRRLTTALTRPVRPALGTRGAPNPVRFSPATDRPTELCVADLRCLLRHRWAPQVLHFLKYRPYCLIRLFNMNDI